MSEPGRLTRRHLVRAALVLGATGCAGTQPQMRTGPLPATTELLEALRARHQRLRSISLQTRTRSWLGGERITATVELIADRSGRLHVEAEVPLRGTIATLVVADGGFALLDLEHKVYRRGPACPANVASLIRIPLLPDEVAAVLMGDAPLAAETRAVAVSWDEKLGAEVLELASPGGGRGTNRLWVAFRRTAGSWDVVAVEGQTAGARDRWRVRYEDLELDGEVTVPGVIRFAEPGKSFDDGVELRIRERTVNPQPRPAVFALSPPPGFPVETVGCDGTGR